MNILKSPSNEMIIELFQSIKKPLLDENIKEWEKIKMKCAITNNIEHYGNMVFIMDLLKSKSFKKGRKEIYDFLLKVKYEDIKSNK